MYNNYFRVLNTDSVALLWGNYNKPFGEVSYNKLPVISQPFLSATPCFNTDLFLLVFMLISGKVIVCFSIKLLQNLDKKVSCFVP